MVEDRKHQLEQYQTSYAEYKSTCDCQKKKEQSIIQQKEQLDKLNEMIQKKEQLCMEEIDSADNLAQIIHGLLSLERKEKTFTGLQEYAQKYQEQPFGHILYFTAEDPGNLADLFAWQCSFQTVRPGEDVGILLI